MTFSLSHMTCGYHNKPVLTNVSFSVETGDILCILGPNGVGKTTLFKSMLGLLSPLSGTLTLDGEDISRWSNRKKAQYIGYIPQSHTPPFPYTVLQVVVMGRVSRLGLFASPGKGDYAAAEQALEALELLPLRDRIYTELSGGERQMVLIARAIAQQPQVLLMDEPTANLDYGNQARVLSQIRRLARRGMIVVMTTHSPDHAFLCSSKVALIERGSRVSFGDADQIVTEQNLRRAYGIPVGILNGGPSHPSMKGCVPLIEIDSPSFTERERNDQT